MNIANPELPESLPPRRRLLNFLLVDDDDICLFIHRRVLELTDYCGSAHSATNGKTALEILQRCALGAMTVPDIILLDLDMPTMNGIAFLEAFRNLDCPNKNRISVVLLTSSVSEKDKEYAISLGVKECISKPLTQEALNTLVGSLYKNNLLPPLMQACL
jgi:CheY-like chemotaxis protein